MAKQLVFRKEGFDKVLKGLNATADAVGGTLGPKGLNVFIDNDMTPKIVNDGVTIANSITFEDKLENAGAYIVKNTSSQTNDDAGDGTTTTSVLLQAIIRECLKRPENPMEVKQSLKEAGDKVLKLLAKKSIPLKKEDIEKVALISSEDKHIARLITEIINKLGDKAIVNVEDSKTFATDYEIVDGYEAHVGFMSPHFVTDKKTGRAIYQDVPVLVVDKKISNLQDITVIFEMFKKEGIGQCVIVCDDIDDSMLGVFVNSKLMGSFNALVIRATGWLLQDIEGATGAKAISNSTGVTFQNFKKENLGFAKKVVCDANKTLFTTDGNAAKKYAVLLNMQAENDPNMYSAKKIREREAKMRGGIAVLRIGASTDFERDYLRLKAEDSVKAVQAALAEGICEGGGMTLWRLAQELKANTIGEHVLKAAMTAPLRKIIENAGKDYTEIITGLKDQFLGFDALDKSNNLVMGYDAKNDKYVDMIKEGIIDPSKVERCALENSVSAASTFITTFALITDVNEHKD